jgi:hypothetical protein
MTKFLIDKLGAIWDLVANLFSYFSLFLWNRFFIVLGLGVTYFSKVLASILVVVWTCPNNNSSFLLGSHSTYVLTMSLFSLWELRYSCGSYFTALAFPLDSLSITDLLWGFFKF